jgi:hypothetical protein
MRSLVVSPSPFAAVLLAPGALPCGGGRPRRLQRASCAARCPGVPAVDCGQVTILGRMMAYLTPQIAACVGFESEIVYLRACASLRRQPSGSLPGCFRKRRGSTIATTAATAL